MRTPAYFGHRFRNDLGHWFQGEQGAQAENRTEEDTSFDKDWVLGREQRRVIPESFFSRVRTENRFALFLAGAC
jgi:hypothetical protein